MAYKSILLHLDNSKSCKKRIEAAAELAQRFDAHLVGLYVTPEIVVPPYVRAQVPIEVLDNQKKVRSEQAEKVVALFEEESRRQGVRAESRTATSHSEEVHRAICLHGRYADLIVIGQHDPDDYASLPNGVVEQVVLSSGRPTLLVPYIGAPKGWSKNCMLAWDGSREAARAADDALPLMQQADKVSVLVVNPKYGVSGHGEEPGADFALHLARHDVKAEAEHLFSSDIEVGDTILSRVSDAGADLLVMGGYGHSRLRELILGGVTRSLLEHMTVPVLMSH